MQRNESHSTESNTVHSVELIVYSLLSKDLDGIYQSIGEMRESQALLILMLRKIKNSLRKESQLLYDKDSWKDDNERLDSLQRRVKLLESRFRNIKLRSDRLEQK